ncbi:MAG: CPBP family intramembrane glutamic endopeptidase [Candidatus Acidiferrum sp.]
MNPFDESPPPQEPDNNSEGQSQQQELFPTPVLSSEVAPGSPTEQGAPSLPLSPAYPEDLRITWSWVHLALFVVFGFVSLLTVQGVMLMRYAPHQHLNATDLEKYMLSKPQIAIGSMLIWYAALFFFLYVTLSILRGHAFWECLGWRKIKTRADGARRNPLVFFISGCGLSLLVAIVSSQMKTPDNMPMEELFKYRQTALLFMAMAVLVAPLVEETLFRGYLYPLFARSFGIAPGILLTGVLFGLMHGAQLGWTWGLVSVMILVGTVFTIVRARTGSVFASYLMHLGYNSLISFFAILGTHGFTKLPVDH